MAPENAIRRPRRGVAVAAAASAGVVDGSGICAFQSCRRLPGRTLLARLGTFFLLPLLLLLPANLFTFPDYQYYYYSTVEFSL